MSESRIRVFILGWVGLGLVLAVTGCQLQIAFIDSPSAPAASALSAFSSPGPARDPGVQLARYQTMNQSPVPLAPGSDYMNQPGHGASAIMPYGPLPPGHVPHDPAGCGPAAYGGPGPIPTEKAKTSLPPYVIEPPDILLLDPIRLVPRPPYVVQPYDVLIVRVAEPLPNQPIDGSYTVLPDGTINLGYSYGLVRVGGLTLEEVEKAIRTHLTRVLKDPQVAVGLAQFRGVQQTKGEHLVRQDGTIHLGSYGCVYVAGLTLNQAKVAIERHLSQYLLDPEVSVDVFAYNSKEYYVITDGAGYGMQVFRFPITGNETVLTAISQIQGLPPVASTKKIWVARPAPANHHCAQILPVDWKAITMGGVTATNYQLFPGDRVYVHSDPLIWFDNVMAKLLAPFERMLGFTLLGTTTVQSFRNNNNNGGGAAFIAPL